MGARIHTIIFNVAENTGQRAMAVLLTFHLPCATFVVFFDAELPIVFCLSELSFF